MQKIARGFNIIYRLIFSYEIITNPEEHPGTLKFLAVMLVLIGIVAIIQAVRYLINPKEFVVSQDQRSPNNNQEEVIDIDYSEVEED